MRQQAATPLSLGVIIFPLIILVFIVSQGCAFEVKEIKEGYLLESDLVFVIIALLFLNFLSLDVHLDSMSCCVHTSYL